MNSGVRGYRPLLVILAVYLIVGGLYNAVTPIFEASDELWHYPAVKYVADHGFQLPIQTPASTTAEWRQEGGQPPLYYMLGAALTFWIDTSDLDSVRHLNPHADIGIIVPDGNVNMIVHDPARESFPWRGAVLAVHLVRLLSVVFGGVTVAMTYLLALELFPGLPLVALGAAALTAFNPMFLFISGSVNNDNLSNALASALLLLIIRLLKQTAMPPLRTLILIGVIAGAGMLAKFNIGFMLPLIALALALIAWRTRSLRPLIVGGIVTGGLTLLIAGWWYLRNVQLYGDPTGLNMFLAIVGSRPIPANLPQLWSERHTFLMSYWGFFGGVNVPLPDGVYTIFNVIAAISGIGIVRWLVQGVRLSLTRQPASAIHLTPRPPLRNHGEGESERNALAIGRLFTAIWIGVLFVSLLRWTSVTWASQGRLMFAAIAPLSVWMAVGLWQFGRGIKWIGPRPLAIGVGWFGTVAVLSILLIARVYDPGSYHFPTQEGTGQRLADFCEAGSCIEVDLGAELPATIRIGNVFQFGVNVAFRANNAASRTPRFTRDWTAFLHLINPDGLIIAQRDVYLGGGTAATSLITRADNWRNQFAIAIPDNTYAPQTLHICLGFYDLKTGERMPLTTALSDPSNPNALCLGSVRVLPRESALAVPNPTSVNFADQAELVGYDISGLSMTPGQKVMLTLYWRAKQKITTDYRVFVHIIDPATTTIFGQDDSMPAAWTRPTTTWQPGEIISDAHTFVIKPDAQPGIWQIEMGMYNQTPDSVFHRLRIITPDGGEALDYAYLSRVLIKPLSFF